MVQRDYCLLSSVDLDEDVCSSSPAKRFLNATSYMSDVGTIESEIHPFAFSTKVQTHSIDNPTYNDIIRLPEEEKKLWDVATVRDGARVKKFEGFRILQDGG